MARFEVKGFETLIHDLNEFANATADLIDEMLIAQADIVVEHQKRKGREYGVYRTGVTLNSIKRKAPKQDDNGRYIIVTPMGNNSKGVRNAEVAFINEYGKRGQKARPFIRDGNKAAEPEADKAAEKIYNDFLKSKNL